MQKHILIIFITLATTLTFAQCPSGQTEVSIDITTDNWGFEAYWELTSTGNNCGSTSTIFSGGNTAVGCNANNVSSGGYPDNTTISEGPWCLTDGASYDILSRDGYGDGGTDFEVNIATFPLLNFNASDGSETFTFTVTPPPAIDGSMQEIELPTYIELLTTLGGGFSIGHEVEGKMKNLGSSTITSMDINYSINGGTTNTHNLSGLNITPFTTFNFIHPTSWTPSTTGAYILDVWISNINGQGGDAVPSNDNLSKTINVKDPIPNIIPSYYAANNTFTFDVIVNASDQVNTPRDLDFHPNGDLWVINTGTENGGGSTVKITNPGKPTQNALWQQDGNAWHFMSLPSGISFSTNGNFATSPSVFDANHNGGTPFTGPTLWSSDPSIYAQPSGGNGSHIDMLHENPNALGIESEEKNIFWLYDSYNQDITMIDFVEDHGPGNDDHSDGRILRYQGMGLSAINTTIVCHLALDKDEFGMAGKWLYFVDGGNQRIIRLDINSGVVGGTPSWPTGGSYEPLAEYKKVLGFTWEIVTNTGLVEPAGIDVIGNRLIVTDHSNGDIIFYDISNIPATEIGRLHTNEPGIMGVVLGPEGKIWYANHNLNKVIKIEPNNIILANEELTIKNSAAIYPNPATDYFCINSSNFNKNDIQLTILDVSGKEALKINDLKENKIDISTLNSGLYFIKITNESQSQLKKLIIE